MTRSSKPLSHQSRNICHPLPPCQQIWVTTIHSHVTSPLQTLGPTWSCGVTDKSLTLVELTIPFETSFHEAQTRKESRCADLTQEATKSGYKTNLITVEMGSRGLAHINGFKKLQKVLSLSKTELQTMITEASRASLTGSYKIWCTRNKILD